MIHFLHTFQPSPILLSLGPLYMRWYGVLIAAGALLGYLLTRSLARRYAIHGDHITALYCYGLLFSFLGARLYHVLNELPYYWRYPLEIPQVWHGGLALHGGIIAGFLTISVYARRHHLRFWQLTDLVAPALILAQAIGRWGNYFNQELFGRPTNLPWGIPIDPANRPASVANEQYFHPTFLYESLWNVVIFVTLILWHRARLQKGKEASHHEGLITLAYLFLYSIGRFGTELLRIDQTPTFAGIRLPWAVSGLFMLASLIGFWYIARRDSSPDTHASSPQEN